MAGQRDPIDAMEAHVRGAVLRAMDDGWGGPPFDPVELAKFLSLRIEARSDIPDARTIATERGFQIEINPLRPRGRVRFSIAHEIAHSFFPDVAEAVRNRGGDPTFAPDDWQLATGTKP